MWPSLALHSWQSPCLSLPGIEIPGVRHFLQSWTSYVPGKLCPSQPQLYPAVPGASFAVRAKGPQTLGTTQERPVVIPLQREQ